MFLLGTVFIMDWKDVLKIIVGKALRVKTRSHLSVILVIKKMFTDVSNHYILY